VCSFIADNDGIFLTFPDFILDVNDHHDCLVSCSCALSSNTVAFHEQSAGKVSAVSDNTRHRCSRRLNGQPAQEKYQKSCQLLGGDSSNAISTTIPCR
jgi:hypothetical protein